MKRLPLLAAALAGAVLGGAAGAWLAGGARLVAVDVSPDGAERLELYTPPRWRCLSLQRRDLAGFVRLTRVRDSQALADSGVLDLSGSGPAIWTRTGVQLGASAVFDRASGRWTVLR